MDNVKFFIAGERIYAGHEEEEMEDNFYTTFKEVSLLNINKEEIRKIFIVLLRTPKKLQKIL